MAKYLLSVWHDDTYQVDFSTPDAQRRVAQVSALNDDLKDAGALVFAGGLHPASSALVVRATDDNELSMTEGPYAASNAQTGGMWIIDTADADAALEWARRATQACEEPIEVRAFQGE